jgi:hypothetical protein
MIHRPGVPTGRPTRTGRLGYEDTMTSPRRTIWLLALVCSLPPAGLSAQDIDFAGQWVPLYQEDHPERLPGPELGDYTGIPLNDAARLRGDSYDPDRISVVQEYQCRQHGGDYSMRGAANLEIRTEFDPADPRRIIAFHTRMGFHNQTRTVYMDGRPHPPEHELHTWAGFSTGAWDGNMLSIRTTHLKTNYLRRNGLPASDKRTFTEHWIRHGELLTVVTVIEDPVFLTERLVRSQSWFLDPTQRMGSNLCEYAAEVPAPEGTVPHRLPGTNPYLKEFSEWYGLPLEATRGGAETLYPEYRSTLKQTFSTLNRCERYCRCGNNGDACPVK